VLLSEETARLGGGYGLFRWRRDYAERDAQELQVYYDHQHVRGGPYDEIRHSAHGEYQRELVPWAGHALIGGVGWRSTTRRISRSLAFATDDPNVANAYYSAFVQDEITLAPERLYLTLGTKAEWFNRAGWELQPSARLLWTPRSNQQVWASLARATRAPSDGEQEIDTRLGIVPAGLLGANAQTIGIVHNPHFRSEVLIASELGYRIQPTPNATFDLALFWNDYENLRSVFLIPPARVSALLLNRARATAVGGELEVQWRVRPDLRLRAAYSGFALKYRGTAGRTAEEPATPKHQWQIGASLDLPGNLELDTTLAYVGKAATLSGTQIDDYVRCDARIAWRPREGLELSLGGQNLTDRRHPEWAFLLGGDNEREIERNVYAAATWQF
jgi:iron complex outermembrane receptor protein